MPGSRNTFAALAAASVAAAQTTTIDIFVPGTLPGLEGPGSVVEASPEITVVALGCSGEGDCPLTVHQGESTWSVSQDGTEIACQLDVPDDVANCEWITPITSIVGELPQIAELFIPMEITAGVDNLPGGGDGGETPAPTTTSATETPAPPPSTPSEPTTVLPTTSDMEDEPAPTEDTGTTGEVTLPVISSSSAWTNGTTLVPTVSSTGGGGDEPAPTDGDGGEEPAPTDGDGDGGDEPAPTDTPAAAVKATGSIFLGGLALVAAFVL